MSRINEAYKVGRSVGRGNITEVSGGQYLDVIKISEEEPSLRLLLRLKDAVAQGERTYTSIYLSELMERETDEQV